MKLVVDIERSQEPGIIHRAGTMGIVVEPIDSDVWLVEVRVHDDPLESSARFETLEVREDEFILIE